MPTVLNMDPNNKYKQLTEKNLLEMGKKFTVLEKKVNSYYEAMFIISRCLRSSILAARKGGVFYPCS